MSYETQWLIRAFVEYGVYAAIAYGVYRVYQNYRQGK